MPNINFAKASVITNEVISTSSRPYFHARRRRLIYLLCTPFLIAFVAFNLLDLDCSNLPSLNHYGERYVLLAEPATEVQFKPLTERIEYLDTSLNLMSQRSRGLISSPNRAPRTPSFLEKARSHLYHVSLPRDSVPG